jgi:glycosyltransferase involved in cell wall biosynthesis
VYVLVSRSEGMPNSLLEAMASGVAVITSNTSSLKEIAEGYGHLVNPLDVDEIGRAIAHCMADDEHRESLVKLGLKRSEEFRWLRTAEQTLGVYMSALNAPRNSETARIEARTTR